MAKVNTSKTNGKTDPEAQRKSVSVADKFDFRLDSLIDKGIALQAQSEAESTLGFMFISIGAANSRATLENTAALQRDAARAVVAKTIFDKTIAASPAQRASFEAAGSPKFRKWKDTDTQQCRSFLQGWQKRTSTYEACGQLLQQLEIAKVNFEKAAPVLSANKLYEIFKAWSRSLKVKKLSLRNKSERDQCRAALIPLWNKCIALPTEKIMLIHEDAGKGKGKKGAAKGAAKLATFPAVEAIGEACESGFYSLEQIDFLLKILKSARPAAIKAEAAKLAAKKGGKKASDTEEEEEEELTVEEVEE